MSEKYFPENQLFFRRTLRFPIRDGAFIRLFCRSKNVFDETSPLSRRLRHCHWESNCSKSPGVMPPVMMDCNILMGLSNRNLAVLMMVMASATFFLPCAVRLPKVIFRKRTLLRIAVSAKLFVGNIAGCFRKTKSSFLWVISRLRMLSALWCDNSECWYSVLNLLRITFLSERYSSAVRMECCL